MRARSVLVGVAPVLLFLVAVLMLLPGPSAALGPRSAAPLPHHVASAVAGSASPVRGSSAFGFAVGDQVDVASPTLNCRQAPSQASTVYSVEQEYEQGLIVAGSVVADGYVWWEVSWDNNYTGWSAEGANGTAWLNNLTGKTVTFDRAAALSYAAEYWGVVTSDGYFWNSGGTYVSYAQGTSVVGLSGDDCAHFVSSVDGNEAHQAGGGINIPSRVPPTYGEPSAPALGNMFLNNGWGIQVNGVETMEPGDMINYEWNPPDGTWDHIAVYVGNGDVAAHTNSHFGANWTLGGAYAYRFIHILATTQGGSGVDRPAVVLTLSSISGSAPLTVTATVAATGGSAAYPLYTIAWGDGTTSSGTSATATHTYASAGSFSVDAAVTDSLGVVGHAKNQTVSVSGSGPSPLTVSLALSATQGSAPFATSLSASASGGAAPYASYAWTFGDGATTTTSTSSSTHTYSVPGTYEASVTVTDSAGANATSSSVAVTVSPSSTALTVSLTASGTGGAAPATIDFTASASGGSGTYGPYQWNFGDGATQGSASATMSHTYTSAGTFGVSVAVSDGVSSATSTTLWVTVTSSSPPPSPLSASLTASTASGSAPLATTFTLTVQGGTSPYRASWNYGDGTSTGLLAFQGGTTSQPHTYVASGTFAVSVTVEDAGGETTHVQLTVSVSTGPSSTPSNPPPTGQASPSPFAALSSGTGLYVLLGLVVVGLAGAATALLLRRRPRYPVPEAGASGAPGAPYDGAASWADPPPP